MATNLQTWLSTQNPLKSNNFIDLFAGAYISAADTVDFSNGGDAILAVGANGNILTNPQGATGLQVSGHLLMGNGLDIVAGVGGNGATDVVAGLGNNAGNGGDGIAITGVLDLGNGGDIAVGLDQVPFFPGLKGTGGNGGTGLSGGGPGGKGGNGINLNGSNARLVAGNGDDQILGVGGNGGTGGADLDIPFFNSGNGGAGGAGGDGLRISNGAQIVTDNGDDTITGIGGAGGQGGLPGPFGSIGPAGAAGFAINNTTIGGTLADGITRYGIDTGRGNDVVDASRGGFGGGGAINMGKGDDVVRGFGSQVIEAGQGLDRLDLGSGTFTSMDAGNGWTKISASSVDMFVRGFEQIVGL